MTKHPESSREAGHLSTWSVYMVTTWHSLPGSHFQWKTSTLGTNTHQLPIHRPTYVQMEPGAKECSSYKHWLLSQCYGVWTLPLSLPAVWHQLISSLLCALVSLAISCIKWDDVHKILSIGCDPKWQLNKCQLKVIQQDIYIHICVHKHPQRWQKPITMTASGRRSIKTTLCSNSILPILPQVSVTIRQWKDHWGKTQFVNVGERTKELVKVGG